MYCNLYEAQKQVSACVSFMLAEGEYKPQRKDRIGPSPTLLTQETWAVREDFCFIHRQNELSSRVETC